MLAASIVKIGEYGNGESVASGIYLSQMVAGEYKSIVKMLLLR